MTTACNSLADVIVLIPAAGRVPEGLLALSNITCPAMVPVAGRPVIHWNLQYLYSLGLRRFVIAVARRGMFIEDFVECTAPSDCGVSFIVPPADGGVGQTVLELAERAQGKSALVVLGDTLFQFREPAILAEEIPTVLVRQVEESYRWCVAEVNDDGRVLALHDKQAAAPEPLNALIGVYYFPKLEELRQAARRAVEQTPPQGRTEISQILESLEARSQLRAVEAEDWLDCGNPDRQASSHQSLLQKRDFNELTVDPVLGTITKRSRHVEKFIDEINYLRLLPPELAILFPRVVAFSTDWNDPWLTMEYYGYPTLAEVFVFENVDPGIWERVFIHLRDIILQGFMQRQRPVSKKAIYDMYLGKTRQRIEQMNAPPELLAFAAHRGPVVVNGQSMANLPALWERLEARVDELAANVRGAAVHGDMCLSNILYDLRSRICKFIDPRGSFGTAGIHGDPRYDVAKLYHSVYGRYDFIVNDLFNVALDGNRASLQIRSLPLHEEIRERFENVFFAHFDRREILLLTGLLFASMPALHYDAPKRQLAMYARSLQLFDELFSPSAVESLGI